MLNDVVRYSACDVSSTRISNGGFFVAVSGEVDLDTAPLLERALSAALAEGASAVAVDLSECTFIDSAAIHTLLRAYAQLGGRLLLVSPPREIRRALAAASHEQTFQLLDSRIQALGIAIAGAAG